MSDKDEESAVRGATTKGSRRRTELLDSAEEILLESGHEGLTLRAVAARAQIRLGHLQYYFPNRADLVGAVLDRTLETSLQRLAPLLWDVEVTRPAEELVRLLLAEHRDTRLVRIYAELWALAGRDEAVGAAVRRFYGSYRNLVFETIRARNPMLPEALCAARAGVLMILIEGASLFRSGIADRVDAATDAVLIATAAALLNPDRDPARIE
ncbi:TetR family transcriptional regulator [Nocardia sp. NPDC050710]|uniref:TetR/AcrR family transcriptional regulator n=1 Tax=Nocardia sp. NPDC050710 TaxID=3157220 RepID=UPI00340ACC45